MKEDYNDKLILTRSLITKLIQAFIEVEQTILSSCQFDEHLQKKYIESELWAQYGYISRNYDNIMSLFKELGVGVD